jgi:nicotinate-nucleotide adenylyltransferase
VPLYQAGPSTRVPRLGRVCLRDGLNLSAGQRVGLFGGSFNPAHEGHLHVAETARVRLQLDRVVWLVSPQNPLKSDKAPSLEARMKDAARLARGPSMQVSDVESRLGTRFTIDTLMALKARHRGVHFVWIMGSDNLAGFHRWRGWRDIMRLMPVAVVARPGSLIDARLSPAARVFARARVPSSRAATLATSSTPAWVYLRAPLNPASSTALRARDGAPKS